jgi:thiamine-monophosphate kinase
MKDKESYFISLFDSPKIGDDGAIVDNLIYSSDLFCEDIHFKREWMSLKEIAYKAMLVNISDAIVMNAKVEYALINIKIPKKFTLSELDELASGFIEASKDYSFEIIGGDTISGDKLDISITLISYSENPIRRDTLKVGDILGFSGELGSVASDLKRLFSGKKIDKSSKFIKPILRDKFFYEASSYFSSAMDISDGLSKELSRLSKLNSIGFEFFTDLDRDKLCSGEEYEILFSCKKEDIKKIEEIAKETDTNVTFFAKAIEGKYKTICKENHFE